MLVFLALAVCAADPQVGDAPAPSWWDGEHVTGEWGGARTWLDDHGVSFGGFYAAEVFTNAPRLLRGAPSTSLLGHAELELTLDTEKLGLWPGGQLYALAQNSMGDGINDFVGSVVPVSNLEAPPFTQVTELFYEQTVLDGGVDVRVGKQDANRDFGTPRFGGNLINGTFGMPPTVPLPSYPTTGLGAVAIVAPVPWLAFKAGIYERDPQVGALDLGVTEAFAKGAGYASAAAVDVKHTYGASKDGGTTTIGAWHTDGDFVGDVRPIVFHENNGVFVQNDERVYSDPGKSGAGMNVIVRVALAQPDRNNVATFVGGSLAWHGLTRDNDTFGSGIGWFSVQKTAHGAGSEFLVDAFYKFRLTHFLSFQPDVEYYRTPGGDGPDALLAGLRVKVKL